MTAISQTHRVHCIQAVGADVANTSNEKMMSQKLLKLSCGVVTCMTSFVSKNCSFLQQLLKFHLLVASGADLDFFIFLSKLINYLKKKIFLSKLINYLKKKITQKV